MTQITVTIPVYNCHSDLVRKAIYSILWQTFQDFQLVVILDGQSHKLSDVRDSRVVVYQLPYNKGRYFCDAVAFTATGTPFYSPHDADDWSSRERLLSLYRLYNLDYPDVVIGNQRWHDYDKIRQPSYPSLYDPVTEHLIYRCNHSGLYTRKQLERIGGYNPQYRVHYDTFMVGLCFLTGTVAFDSKPLYHRVKRQNSLTETPSTGRSSPYRQQVRKELAEVYRKVYHLYNTEPEYIRLVKVRNYLQSLIPEQLMDEVQYHADKLKRFVD